MALFLRRRYQKKKASSSTEFNPRMTSVFIVRDSRQTTRNNENDKNTKRWMMIKDYNNEASGLYNITSAFINAVFDSFSA